MRHENEGMYRGYRGGGEGKTLTCGHGLSRRSVAEGKQNLVRVALETKSDD